MSVWSPPFHRLERSRMSEVQLHPLEAVLRLCARLAPEPWFFRVHAQEHGIDPDILIDILELLWLEGLVQKAAGTPQTGPGAVLTDKGRRVLAEPALLE